MVDMRNADTKRLEWLYKGHVIRKVTEDKWVIYGWRGHSGYTSLAAAKRSVDRQRVPVTSNEGDADA